MAALHWGCKALSQFGKEAKVPFVVGVTKLRKSYCTQGKISTCRWAVRPGVRQSIASACSGEGTGADTSLPPRPAPQGTAPSTHPSLRPKHLSPPAHRGRPPAPWPAGTRAGVPIGWGPREPGGAGSPPQPHEGAAAPRRGAPRSRRGPAGGGCGAKPPSRCPAPAPPRPGPGTPLGSIRPAWHLPGAQVANRGHLTARLQSQAGKKSRG